MSSVLIVISAVITLLGLVGVKSRTMEDLHGIRTGMPYIFV